MRHTELEKGDVVLFHGRGWVSSAIRRFSQGPKEKRPSVFNHVAIAVGKDAMVEALLSGVKRTNFFLRSRDAGERVLVARKIGLTELERGNLMLEATRQVGRKYGYAKIAGHFGDWALSKVAQRNVYFFRRMTGNGNYPICSWVVGYAYFYTLPGFCFNMVSPQYCQPDDIGDEIVENIRDKWQIVYAHPDLVKAEEWNYECNITRMPGDKV